MNLMQAAGLTPFQILQSATTNPARFLAREDECGTVTVGKRADLLLVRQNPLLSWAACLGLAGLLLLPSPVARCAQDAQGSAAGAARNEKNIADALGVSPALEQLHALEAKREGSTPAASMIREQVLEQVLLASFELDDTLSRIDAEAAHANEIRAVMQAEREHRQSVLNIATFAVGGTLGAAGSAMELTRNLNHAGNAVQLASSASAVGLSTAQLLGGKGGRHLFRSPYNMLAEVLGQKPNNASEYPSVVTAYLRSADAGDGQPQDDAAPDSSLRAAWYRLHRLQGANTKGGSSLASVTSDPSDGLKLTEAELIDREAMLRDLHGAVSLLKGDLRAVLLTMARESPAAAKP